MGKMLSDFVLSSIRISVRGVHTKQYFEIKGQCVFLFFFFFFFSPAWVLVSLTFC